MKPPVLAYLTDKTGRVYETLPIYARKPKQDVESMNGTAKAYTDGKLFWTITNPQQGATP